MVVILTLSNETFLIFQIFWNIDFSFFVWNDDIQRLLNCRWEVLWNCWKPILHGSGSPEAKLWTRDRYMECWSHPLHFIMWSAPILGWYISPSYPPPLHADEMWCPILLNCILQSRMNLFRGWTSYFEVQWWHMHAFIFWLFKLHNSEEANVSL